MRAKNRVKIRPLRILFKKKEPLKGEILHLNERKRKQKRKRDKRDKKAHAKMEDASKMHQQEKRKATKKQSNFWRIQYKKSV